MSIFSKQVHSIDYADLAELLNDGARENIRLEYKREIPARFETIKKLSSFANTYGGYVIIGAEEDGSGNISGLPGVAPSSGFNQQVIQWCYDGIYPPVSPFVSNAIEDPNSTGTVFYVIYVNQSHETPHFLTDRRGCFIRTDEFSQRFEARLATYEEISHLADRRARSVRLRERTLSRARDRLSEHIRQNYEAHRGSTGQIDTTMWISVSLLYPELEPYQVADIQRALDECRTTARGVMIPDGIPQAQVDGFYYPGPRITKFSYLEVDVYGEVFYAEEVGHILPDTQLESGIEPEPQDIYVYVRWILAWTIFYLRYANRLYSAIGYDGPLMVRLGLDRIRGRRIRVSLNQRGNRFDESRPMLDDAIELARQTDTRTLRNDFIGLISDLFRAVTFSCGWGRAYSAEDEFVGLSIDRAQNYIQWPREALPS